MAHQLAQYPGGDGHGNDFTEPLTWTEAEPTVEVKGPSQGGQNHCLTRPY